MSAQKHSKATADSLSSVVHAVHVEPVEDKHIILPENIRWAIRESALLSEIIYEDNIAAALTKYASKITEFALVKNEQSKIEEKIMIAEANHNDSKYFFVVFRGTANQGDILSDLNILPNADLLHSGFYDRTLSIPMNLLISKIQQNYQIVLTGHSLGGACACLLTTRLIKEFPTTGTSIGSHVKCITFASPLVATGSMTDLMNSYQNIFFHCVAENDIVPRILSVSKYLHILVKDMKLYFLSFLVDLLKYGAFGTFVYLVDSEQYGISYFLLDKTQFEMKLEMDPNFSLKYNDYDSIIRALQTGTSDHSMTKYIQRLTLSAVIDEHGVHDVVNVVARKITPIISIYSFVATASTISFKGDNLVYVYDLEGNNFDISNKSLNQQTNNILNYSLPNNKGLDISKLDLKIYTLFGVIEILSVYPMEVQHKIPYELVAELIPFTSLLKNRVKETSKLNSALQQLTHNIYNLECYIPIEFAFNILTVDFSKNNTDENISHLKLLVETVQDTDFDFQSICSEYMLIVLQIASNNLNSNCANPKFKELFSTLFSISNLVINFEYYIYNQYNTTIYIRKEYSKPISKEEQWRNIIFKLIRVSFSFYKDKDSETLSQWYLVQHEQYLFDNQLFEIKSIEKELYLYGSNNNIVRSIFRVSCVDITDHRIISTYDIIHYSFYGKFDSTNVNLKENLFALWTDYVNFLNTKECKRSPTIPILIEGVSIEESILIGICLKLFQYDDKIKERFDFLLDEVKRKDIENQINLKSDITNNIYSILSKYIHYQSSTSFLYSYPLAALNKFIRSLEPLNVVKNKITNLLRQMKATQLIIGAPFFCGKSIKMLVTRKGHLVNFTTFLHESPFSVSGNQINSIEETYEKLRNISDKLNGLKGILNESMIVSKSSMFEQEETNSLYIAANIGFAAIVTIPYMLFLLGSTASSILSQDNTNKITAAKAIFELYHQVAHRRVSFDGYNSMLDFYLKYISDRKRILIDTSRAQSLRVKEEIIYDNLPKDFGVYSHDELQNNCQIIMQGSVFQSLLPERNKAAHLFILKLIHNNFNLINLRNCFKIVTLFGGKDAGKTTLTNYLCGLSLPTGVGHIKNTTLFPTMYSLLNEDSIGLIDLPGVTDPNTSYISKYFIKSFDIAILVINVKGLSSVALHPDPKKNKHIGDLSFIQFVEELINSKVGPRLICFNCANEFFENETLENCLNHLREIVDNWRKDNFNRSSQMLDKSWGKSLESYSTGLLECEKNKKDAVIYSGYVSHQSKRIRQISFWFTCFKNNLVNNASFVNDNIFSPDDVRQWIMEVHNNLD